MTLRNPFNKIFFDIENSKVQPAWLILTLASIVFIRIVLEWTLEAQRTVESQQSLLLFFLYFSSVLCILAILLWLFSGRPFESALKIVAAFSPVLWIPPLLDFILSSGKGYTLEFMFNPAGFWQGVGSFCAACSGVSPGLRFEVLVAVLVAAAYVLYATRNILKSALVAGLFYLFVIVQAFLPGFFMVFFGHAVQDVFLFRELLSSYAILISAAVLVASYSLRRNLADWFYSLRLERGFHYVGLVLMGALIGRHAWGHSGWGALLPLASLVFGVFFAFLAASALNDYFDRPIDRVSSPKKKSDVNPFGRIAFFYVLGILSAAAAGYIAAAWVLFASGLSIVYSVPPLRLRRHFVSASLVIAGCSLSVFLAGLTVGLTQPETAIVLPSTGLLAALVAGFVLLASHFKDLKDVTGDGRNGVLTLPVWLGIVKARKAIAAFLFLAVMWATALSGLSWAVGVGFALAAAAVVTRVHDFRRMELFIFSLDYAFIALLALHLSGIWVFS